MILEPFQCSFCKYPQLHYFIKWQQMTSAGQTLYRILCLHIYGGGNVYLDRDVEKPGSPAHLPKRTGCTLWFFRISAGTKLNCAFNNSGLNSKKNNKIKCKYLNVCLIYGKPWLRVKVFTPICLKIGVKVKSFTL